jgi:hypothetical protein
MYNYYLIFVSIKYFTHYVKKKMNNIFIEIKLNKKYNKKKMKLYFLR